MTHPRGGNQHERRARGLAMRQRLLARCEQAIATNTPLSDMKTLAAELEMVSMGALYQHIAHLYGKGELRRMRGAKYGIGLVFQLKDGRMTPILLP